MKIEEVKDPLRPLSEITEPDARQRNLLGTLESRHAELSAITLHAGVALKVRQLVRDSEERFSLFLVRLSVPPGSGDGGIRGSRDGSGNTPRTGPFTIEAIYARSAPHEGTAEGIDYERGVFRC